MEGHDDVTVSVPLMEIVREISQVVRMRNGNVWAALTECSNDLRSFLGFPVELCRARSIAINVVAMYQIS
jgi:hypothetical protein